MKEQISALMDGELDDAQMQQLIRGLRTDEQSRHCWDQYHLIGDALRNNLPGDLDKDFAARVSQAIAVENIPQAPPSQPEPKQASHSHHVAKPWMGFAVAASVAAIAYVGVGLMTVEDATGPRVASVTPPAATVAVVPAQPSNGSLQTVQGSQWKTGPSATYANAKLNPYLYNHRDVAGVTPIGAQVIPHARLVSGPVVVRGQ